MNVLRVSISYPRKDMPGVGLSSYYHSYYSNDNNLIITSYKMSPKKKNKSNVKIIEVPLYSFDLGNIASSGIVNFFKFLRKSVAILIFLIKSIKHIEMFKPKIVHVYSPIPILFGIYCKIRFGSTIMMSLHGTDVERIYKSRIYRKILDIPDAVLSVSKKTEQRLNEANINQKVEFMGNGFDDLTFYNQKKKRVNQLIHVASLRWQKGQEYLIKAFAKLCVVHPEISLIIIGDGEDYNVLKKLVNELGIEENVVFKGVCDREIINSELNKSKGFVLSSILEGSPKVIFEAMSTGTPIVSTNVGNVKIVVKDSGIIVPPKDVDSLYLAMRTLVETEKWRGMSIKAEKYSKDYTWDKVAQRLEKIYKRHSIY